MNKLKIAVFSLLAMFIFTGCSMKNNDSDLIKINQTVITQKEFDKAYETVTSNNMFSQMGLDLKTDPDNTFALMMKERVVSELIVKALLNEDMQKRNIKVTSDELKKAEDVLIEQIGSKDQFLQILKTNGVTYDQFKKDLEEEIKLKKYMDAIAIVSVGEKEAKKYYDENVDKFKYPKKVRASHILIAANPEQIEVQLRQENKNKDLSDEEIEKEVAKKLDDSLKVAQELQSKVKKAPATFAKVAKENSHDTASAIRGGDLGFFSKDEMVEAFANKAFSMAPNTISEVVQTPYGYHIIMVTDRAEAGTMGFEETKKDIITYLEGRDKVDILRNKIEALRKDAKIEYVNADFNPENIQKKIKDSSIKPDNSPKKSDNDKSENK